LQCCFFFNNMAIYLTPLNFPLVFFIHLPATWLRIFLSFREKITRPPPPPLIPVPTKLLLSTEHNVEACYVCFARSKKKKNKPGKVNVVPTFLVKTRVPRKRCHLRLLQDEQSQPINSVLLVPGLEELVR
jgi:hypothetical protein